MSNHQTVPTTAMNVLAPGSRVTVEGVPATITAVQIWEGGHVVYQTVWWDGRERKAEWLEPCEFRVGDKTTMRIGFRGQE